jgi:hypothetical protein
LGSFKNLQTLFGNKIRQINKNKSASCRALKETVGPLPENGDGSKDGHGQPAEAGQWAQLHYIGRDDRTQPTRHRAKQKSLKGTVSRDFLLYVFFMNYLPPGPKL